ncbi:MAG: hypothetical protein ABGX26_01030 [Nautiliaceae bacterium]
MILEFHPKSRKITIEIPEEFIDKDVEVIVREKKSNLDELFGIFSDIKPNYEMEEKAWELAVLENYGKKNDKN